MIETKKTALTSFTILCLLSTVFLVGLALNIQPVKASGTIYIRADGSVEGTTDISTVDNVTYTFTNNISDSIVVDRDNIVVNGANYTIQGKGDLGSTGIRLSGADNVTISDMEIRSFNFGIILGFPSRFNIISGNNITNNAFGITNQVGYFVSNNLISENTIANNSYGIRLEGKNNTISGNHITNNDHGIRLVDPYSMNFTISGNDIANNGEGIVFDYTFNHFIYHNNFVNNTHHTQSGNSMNIWDDGYPSGGNYWSDYEEKYPEAEELGNSGLWDTPYVIDSDDQDHFPLVNPWPPSEHELVVSARAPTSLQPGGSSSLNATVTNRGLSDESNVDLVLLINGTTVDSTSISLLQAGDSHTLSYLWTPPTEGAYNVTAYAHPVSGETSTENNQMSRFVTVSAIAPPPEAQVGVKAGDWIKCDYAVTGWPSVTPYPEWLKVEILSVEETTATVKVTLHLSDGTEQSDTVNVDVFAGGGTFDTLFGFLIPADCSTGDSITMGGNGFTFNVTIDGETTRTYTGTSRTVVYASFSQYGTQLTYYWDKQTGILVEASTTGGGVTATAKATETNMWEATPPFWMQWWFYAIVAVVIIVSAGAVYLKRRKPPTPTPPSGSVEQSK